MLERPFCYRRAQSFEFSAGGVNCGMNVLDRREVEDSIAAFIRRRSPQVAERALGADSRLLDDGLIDSLGVLELMSFLAETYRIETADDDFLPENFDTIGSLAGFVERKRAG